MIDLEDALRRWKEEEPRYKELTPFIYGKIKEALFNEGFGETIEFRTKDACSLIKKLYEKNSEDPNYSYDNITDKTGVRINCRFKEDVTRISDIIENLFDCCKREDHSDNLTYNEQGYKSVHIDVLFEKGQDNLEECQKFDDLKAEIQIRTLCENVWADIYHDLGYKPVVALPDNINRELYCLGGLLEIADGCFSSIKLTIDENQKLNERYILSKLEKPHFRLIRTYYSASFSLKNIEVLIPLLNFTSPSEFDIAMNEFISTNSDKIKFILEERKSERIKIPYLTQPELLLIFYLIENEIDQLNTLWEENFYINDLRKLSLWWSNSIDDLDEIL